MPERWHGLKKFDCSGLVIRAIHDVLGSSSPNEGEFRHVREIWQTANAPEHPNLHIAKLTEGVLVVLQRQYTIGGQDVIIPGHVGIVTGTTAGTRMVHGNPRTGRVKEELIKDPSTIMGYIDVR